MKLWTNAASIRMSLGLCVLVGGCLFLTFPPRHPPHNISWKSIFTEETGIPTEESWTVLTSGDDHGGFVGDGETHVVMQLPQEAVDRLVKSSAPWSGKWKSGPIPHEIGFHCRFGTDGVSYGSVNGGPNEYHGDSELVALLNSSHVLYDAKERCCDSLHWHNGHLLIVDPHQKRVWLSVWDF